MSNSHVKDPNIGDTVNVARAVALYKKYGLDTRYPKIMNELRTTPGKFQDWVFDGASMVPDAQVSGVIPGITGIALVHDLKYAYGELAKEDYEREDADQEFRDAIEKDMIKHKSPVPVASFIAQMMYRAIRAGGGSKTKMPWSWGFARKP